MLKALIRFSLDRPGVIVLLAVALLIALGVVLPKMPVDVFPELNAPTVVIMAEAGGLSADEVEQYVTFHVEAAVNGLPGVRRVRSSSATSLSIVWVEFDWGADLYDARQLVAERIRFAQENLPEGVHMEMSPISSIAGEIMLVSMTRADDSQLTDLELRSYAEYDATTRLQSIPGVAKVVSIGASLPEYQVNVRQDRLRLYGLTVQDVVDAAGQAHTTASGGYLVWYEGMELPIRQTGRVRSIGDIRNTLVHVTDDENGGRPITIGEVADVVVGPALRRGTASEAGRPAVVVSIQKTPGTNTLELTKQVQAAIDELQATAPEGVTLNSNVFRQADFINIAVHNVTDVLLEAAIFVAIVLVLFLLNVRTTLITLTALPLSLAMAFLILWWLDIGINVMTLGGLAVAIGELVDDAIIDVENVWRRLRENWAKPPGEQLPVKTVVFAASNEIRSSIAFATLLIVIVFLPLLFLQGLEGRFFQPMGVAYIVAITASLLVAVTITPALCRMLLGWRIGRNKTGATPHVDRDGFLVRFIKWLYRPSLRIALRFRWLVLALAALATVASLMLAATFGRSFLPEFNEGTYTVFLMAPPGTSLDESDRLAIGVERRLAAIEDVKAVARRTGRAERDEHAEPPSSSEIEVVVRPGGDHEKVREKIDEILSTVPGITTMVGQPISHRLSHVMSGTPAAIAINVFGEDLDVLRKVAKEMETALRDLPGARDVNANREVMITTLPVEYHHDDLSRFGLTPQLAAEQVSAAFYGARVESVYQGIRRYDIVVRLTPEERQTPRDLENLLLRGINGATVRLRDVATVGIEQASNLIARENMRRKAVISCNVAPGSNLGDLVTEVQARVAPIIQKHGVSVVYGGQFEAQQSASEVLLVGGAAVLFLMLIILTAALQSVPAALLVMVNLPLALIGGIVAIFLTASAHPITNAMALFGQGDMAYIAPVISIASMVGFVTLFGIAVRNGILLVNHYRHLMLEESKTREEAVLIGSEERLVPILMTAITAVLGLVPMAMRAGHPGSELLAPLAVVVLGGLVTSTFLNLVVVPAGYIAFIRGVRGDDDEGDGGFIERPPQPTAPTAPTTPTTPTTPIPDVPVLPPTPMAPQFDLAPETPTHPDTSPYPNGDVQDSGEVDAPPPADPTTETPDPGAN